MGDKNLFEGRKKIDFSSGILYFKPKLIVLLQPF
jgi:hypothetical protein